MTRNKVKIEYIQDDMGRKISFNKRKKSLCKMVEQLSTLCGVDACAIIFGHEAGEPEVWPPTPEVERVITKFRSIPDFQRADKMQNQESFTLERIAKAQEKARKLTKENRENEMTLAMYKCLAGEGSSDGMSLTDLNEMRALVDAKINEITSRILTLEEERRRSLVAMRNLMNNDNAANDQNGAN